MHSFHKSMQVLKVSCVINNHGQWNLERQDKVLELPFPKDRCGVERVLLGFCNFKPLPHHCSLFYLAGPKSREFSGSFIPNIPM